MITLCQASKQKNANLLGYSKFMSEQSNWPQLC